MNQGQSGKCGSSVRLAAQFPALAASAAWTCCVWTCTRRRRALPHPTLTLMMGVEMFLAALMISLMRGTPSVTFMLATPAKWNVLRVICVPGSPAQAGGHRGLERGEDRQKRRGNAPPLPALHAQPRIHSQRSWPGPPLRRVCPPGSGGPYPGGSSPSSPIDCAPKAPTVAPGSMRLLSYRVVHCSTNARSSAAVTPTAGRGGGRTGRRSTGQSQTLAVGCGGTHV